MQVTELETKTGDYRGHSVVLVFKYAKAGEDAFLTGVDITVDQNLIFAQTPGFVITGETESHVYADVRRYIDFLEDGPPKT